jgi:hypothetical protein
LTSPATLGTPCLVPVQVDVHDGPVRGFITRLSRASAAVSTDPELPEGARVTLRFRRPTDNSDVEISGTVSGLLAGGGLWRGRSAALVALDEDLEDDFFGGPELAPDSPRRRGSEAGRTPRQAASFGGAFTAGLGRRRRPASTPAAPAPVSRPPPPKRSLETEKQLMALSDAWAPVAVPAELRAPPVANDDDLDTVPPGALADPSASLAPTPDALLATNDLPPIQDTHPELSAASAPDFDELGIVDPDSSDDDFFGQFGRVQDLPDYHLPPGAGDDLPDLPGDLPPLADGLPGTRSDFAAAPSSRPEPPGLAADGYFDLGAPAVARPDRSPDATFGDLLETGVDRPAVMNTGEAPPPVQDPSLDQGRAPWEEDDDRAAMSLIPRNARIASALPVTFWARGRSNQATAQNFSKEGLFLGTKGDPPVRGAIVRIEFPIEGEGEPVPVRFNAEVRWHQSDRPQSGLPEGFGVQILTFESPKDRVRYDELLMLILTLNAERDRAEASSFKWGPSGGGVR